MLAGAARAMVDILRRMLAWSRWLASRSQRAKRAIGEGWYRVRVMTKGVPPTTSSSSASQREIRLRALSPTGVEN